MFKKALVGVAGVHDLHIWSLSTTNTVLTAHLVMPGGHPGDGFLVQIANDLSHEFSISHASLQVETNDLDQCSLKPDDVI